ncbi:MAG: penicillin-insensitive murein endopeptidase [Deltaproteobacteria bacterium]|nr:penicillin-insensitive murein endopeptidase [Deltaproteobacteria bacterium]
MTRAIVVVMALLFAAPVAGKCPKGTKRLQTNVRKGESLADVAGRVGVKAADLKAWNLLRKDEVPAGKNLAYCVKKASGSVGSPSHGKLVGGTSVDGDGDKAGAGFVIGAGRTRLFGTAQTVKHLKHCMAVYRAAYPDKRKAPPVNVGDLSAKDGGPAGPHLSHESGRDVDIGYLTKPPQSKGNFDRQATGAADLDVPKQWVVTKCFLDNPELKAIFIGSGVLGALKAYVGKVYRKRPAMKDKYLKALGRYAVPDGEHLTHMHVRFRCPKSDKHCVD